MSNSHLLIGLVFLICNVCWATCVYFQVERNLEVDRALEMLAFNHDALTTKISAKWLEEEIAKRGDL